MASQRKLTPTQKTTYKKERGPRKYLYSDAFKALRDNGYKKRSGDAKRSGWETWSKKGAKGKTLYAKIKRKTARSRQLADIEEGRKGKKKTVFDIYYLKPLKVSRK
jgi:hypothetical protein